MPRAPVLSSRLVGLLRHPRPPPGCPMPRNEARGGVLSSEFLLICPHNCPSGFRRSLLLVTDYSQGPAMNDSALVIRNLADGVLTLTLNRPESLNALNAPLVIELRAALDAATRDAEVGVIVLRGAGRGFSAGGDLR